MIRPATNKLLFAASALFCVFAITPTSRSCAAGETAEPARIDNVIYGRKFGMALTMDVYIPANANGAGAVYVVNGGWKSSYAKTDNDFVRTQVSMLFDRGYTVFLALYGSHPKFTIPESVSDVRRAVRFVRHSAERFKIDPERLGIYGVSAGGHLALMAGMDSDDGNARARDPVEVHPCRVAAVACMAPVTDFVNYGGPGKLVVDHHVLRQYRHIFRFEDFDPFQSRLIAVDEPAEVHRRLARISPINYVDSQDPPTLIIHGELDENAPLQQAGSMAAKLAASDVAVKLILKPGVGHSWPGMEGDISLVADWFDQRLQ